MSTINRSAKTGKFVTKKTAKKHPATTVTEKVSRPNVKHIIADIQNLLQQLKRELK